MVMPSGRQNCSSTNVIHREAIENDTKLGSRWVGSILQVLSDVLVGENCRKEWFEKME